MSYLKSVFTLTVLLFFSLNLFGQLVDFREGCAPMTVNFSPPPGAQTFFWTFGNSTTSQDANPTQIYTTPGTYPITFSLTPGGAVTARDTVFVYEKPNVTFEADSLVGCVPFEVTFTGTTIFDPRIDISSYDWAFGDGNNGSGADVTHTYNSAGNFNVQLVMESSMPGCRSSLIKEDYILVNAAPPALPSANQTAACDPPLNVTFTNNTPNQPNFSYAWDFGNGQTSTDRNPGTITYDDAGTFNATLTVTDDLGCSKDSTIIINIGGPLVDIVVPDTICASPIPFTIRNGSSNGNYFWTFSAPASPRNSTRRQPNVTFPDAGNYDITLTVTDPSGNCSNTLTKTIYAEAPTTDFTIDPTYACEYPTDLVFTPVGSDFITVEWTISDPSLDSVYNSNDTVAEYTIQPDTSVYGLNGLREISATMRILNSRGCLAFQTKKDTFFAPNARFNTDTVMGCAPLEVTFYDSMSVSNEAIRSYTYVWGDGTLNSSFSNDDPVTHTFTQPGEYDVVLIVENEADCVDTSYAVRIFVGEPIAADFTVDKTTICPGESIQFSGIGDTTLIDAWHFDADGSRMSHCADDRNPSWDFESETGMMNATMTVIYNGCPTTVEKSNLITVRGPIAQLDYLNDCDNKFMVAFADSSHDATSLSWDFGDQSGLNTNANPTHTYAQTGDYQVILTASNPGTGCPDSRDTTMVHIRNLQAGFELEDNYCQGETFMFDASSSTDVNATCWKGYTWFPSDSRPITTEEVMIDYSWTGIDTQTLELIVQDINGCQDTLRDTTVVWKVDAEAEADPLRLCAPNDVAFTDLTTGNAPIVKWKWLFGDGDSTDVQNPIHTYTSTPVPTTGDTVYNVIFIAFDSLNCSDTLQFNVDFYEPMSEILVSDDAICVGDQITYSATDFNSEGSFLTYIWYLNGDSINNAQGGDLTFNQAGNFTLQVDFIESATGCTGSTEVVINVQDFPNAGFTSPIDGNAVNCAGQNITFTADDIDPNLSYTWNMGDGTIIPPSGNSGVIDYPYGRGTFTTELTVETTNGCPSTTSREYTFVSPEGFLTADALEICPGDQVTFGIRDTVDVSSWEIVVGSQSFVDEAPVTVTFDQSGIIPVTLKTSLSVSGLECVTDDMLDIEVYDMNIDFSTDRPSYCPGDLVQFLTSDVGANVDFFTWDFGDGSANSADQDPTHVYNTTGNYDVTLAVRNNDLGCTNSITKTVDVSGDLNLDITDDTQICFGDTTLIEVANPDNRNWTYRWNPAAPSSAIIAVSPNQTTEYTVTVTDNDTNCTDEASVSIEVLQRPNFQPDTVSIMVKFTPEGGTFEPVALPPLPEGAAGFSITWNPNNDLDISDPINPVLTDIGFNPDTLRYNATVGNRCGSVTWQRRVNVFKVPNLFSPGNDMLNDYFNIFFTNSNEAVNAQDIVTFKVFNRWGQQVYNNETPITGWDGRVNGEPQISDVYVYKIEVRLPDGSIGRCEGDVTLYR